MTERSRNDIGRKLVLDEGDAIPEKQLPFLETLDLQQIGARGASSAEIAASRSRCSCRSRASCSRNSRSSSFVIATVGYPSINYPARIWRSKQTAFRSTLSKTARKPLCDCGRSRPSITVPDYGMGGSLCQNSALFQVG